MSHSLKQPALNTSGAEIARREMDFAARDWDLRMILFLLAHFGLGFLLRVDPVFATIHALLALALGLIYLREMEPEKMIYVAAYISASELLWRGLDAGVFWEFGKYTVALFLIAAIFKHYRAQLPEKWPLVYFVLLLPSILLLPGFDRQAISFNLSGPLVLAVAVIFFGGVRFSLGQLKKLLAALIAPVISLAAISLYSSLTAGLISFDLAYSEKITSAGIGPNQVSSILGLGAFAAFLYAVLETRSRQVRWIMIGLTIWLLAQSALTFSRGGFWTALGAMLVAGWYFFWERRSRFIFLSTISLIFLLGYFIVFPQLDALTSNTLSARFSDFELTGRGEIMLADWLTFLDNPVLGVGPDQSTAFHALTFRVSRAHTEYTRMLAEHGLFGLVSLLILLGAVLARVFKTASAQQKALVISFTAWALVFMFHAAMRLSAPSFLFGVAAARFITEDSQPADDETG